MVQGSVSETERKIIAILKVLNESSEPLGSITIARELEHHGIFLSERAVRYHLRITDERGHTQPFGRDGRMLTAQGLEELKIALAPEHVGFVLEKLETLAFQTSFNPRTRTGLVPINTSLIAKDRFKEALAIVDEAYTAGFCVSDLIAVANEGEKLGSVIVPEGKDRHRYNMQCCGQWCFIEIGCSDIIKIRWGIGIEKSETGTFCGYYLLRGYFIRPIRAIH